MKIVKRLRRGENIRESLQSLLAENKVSAAVLLSAVGCVTVARLRDATGIEIHDIKENMELISLCGTLSCERTHLHASFSKSDLSVIGGHFIDGIVNTTCELVIETLEGYSFKEEYDSETGYGELKAEKEK